MNNDLRDRAILPVLIPVGAIILAEVVVFSLSRVLLATGGKTAVGVALGVSLVILIGATALAGGRKARTGATVGALALFVIAMVVAGAVAYQRGPAYAKEEAANRPKVALTAASVAFSTKTLKLNAAGTEIDFANKDNQPHNIAIFPSEKEIAKRLFTGTIVQPGSSVVYQIPKLAPGTYYFHCDVHPQQMTGTATVT